MALPDNLRQLIKDSHWPVYICSNTSCMNSVNEPTYEQACGTSWAIAPKTIKCTKCGSDMNLQAKKDKLPTGF